MRVSIIIIIVVLLTAMASAFTLPQAQQAVNELHATVISKKNQKPDKVFIDIQFFGKDLGDITAMVHPLLTPLVPDSIPGFAEIGINAPQELLSQ